MTYLSSERRLLMLLNPSKPGGHVLVPLLSAHELREAIGRATSTTEPAETAGAASNRGLVRCHTATAERPATAVQSEPVRRVVMAHATAATTAAPHSHAAHPAAATARLVEVLLSERVSDVQSVLLEHELLLFERQHFARVRLVVVGDEAVAARVAALVRDDPRVLDVTEMREVVAQLVLRRLAKHRIKAQPSTSGR